MIGKYFKKTFFNKNILLVYCIAYLYCIYQLLLIIEYQYIDATIVTANTFCLTMNQVFLFHIIRRNRNIYKNIDNILIRIKKDEFINKMIKLSICESIIQVFIIYIVPILIFYNSIYSLSVYLSFIFITLFLFIFYQLIEIIVIFVNDKYIKNFLLCMPFLLNLSLQIFFISRLYVLLGGL